MVILLSHWGYGKGEKEKAGRGEERGRGNIPNFASFTLLCPGTDGAACFGK